ncbi:histone-lysine N-methyltransferase SUV39H2-like isoform X2 [Argiope bruennichi]|uniref:histone-lysine N-methyltransferase SUV39H2-like isoform X2 n=1 Tax=Argiope bruennichi TaxID=94029 RepID=UPI0024959A04|nr:histone-lysine N-methyltransferase SUV39H2-like isoform X2 [Argiope bruennichi]
MDIGETTSTFNFASVENSDALTENIADDLIKNLSSPSKAIHPFIMDKSGCEKFKISTLPKISSEYHHTDIFDNDSEHRNSDSMDVEELSHSTDSSKSESVSEVSVRCLQSYDGLKNTCVEMGLSFVDTSEGKLYEVDLILDRKIEGGKTFYLVKWQNYALKYNTWEPDYHLIGCQDMIAYYEDLNSSSCELSKSMLVYFIRELTTRKPYDILTLTKLLSLINDTSEDEINKLKLSFTQMKHKVKEIMGRSLSNFTKIKQRLINLMKFSEMRKRVLINLKEWEKDLNTHNPAPYIEVENNVDLEEAPTGFKFIHDYVTTSVTINEEPVAFCSCNNCFENKNSCCPLDSDAHFAYNKYRRLQLHPGYPVYECNKLCKCGKDCINRVVQNGQKVKVAIFRTSNGRGWGLKTLETIQKDQFVLEYLGEIVTSDEAEMRGNIYDYVERSYLFDLDYGEENCQYTVDAGHVGNAAHFINHSCDPNLHVFAVWINQQDPHLPRLAFFAKKKINRGEELTFDYKMVKNHGRFGDKPSQLEERIPCKCNSRNCKNYLF